MISIVVVAYNRDVSVKRLLDSLLLASYPENVPLIISIDKSETNSVELLADEFHWPYGEKIVVKHSKNLGLKNHILSIGDYTNHYDGVIVLEDDLEVSPSFYTFAMEAVKRYKDDDRIAGISLYSFPINLQTSLPFFPERNEFDVFFFQNAQSWGQVWMKKSWSHFKEWYMSNSEDFSDQAHLPYTICRWGKNSWLKYHIKYCIEQDKYFVYPYTSLTYCSGAAGVHNSEDNNYTQCSILRGSMKNFRFPSFKDAIKYDGFYERVDLNTFLNVDDICIDLNGGKMNRMHNRYWLTTKRAHYKVIKSYGLNYIPIEQNIICNVDGSSIFLYDTYESGKLPGNNFLSIISYYKYNSLFSYMFKCGFGKSLINLSRYILHKFLKRI